MSRGWIEVLGGATSALIGLLPIPPGARGATGRWLQGVGTDLRYTARALRRSPVFTAVVILTLALGIGGATGLLHVVRTVYQGALPFVDGDRLVRIRNSNLSPTGEIRRYNITPADYRLIERENRVFGQVAAGVGRSLSLIGDGPAERISAIGVSARWLQMLGIRPLLGRPFTAAEDSAGTDAGVALISHALWLRRFGGDSGAVGQPFRFDGGIATVVGVLPPGFHYPYDADVWTPWTFDPADVRNGSLNVVARLADGAALAGARADAARIHGVRSGLGLQTSASGFDVATVRADFIRDEARILDALAAAVLFLLVLTCVNVANLLVGRFATRRAEIGVRAALGGGRGRQLRQLLVEALALFAAGGLGGIVLSFWLGRTLVVLIPDNLRDLGVSGSGFAPGTIAIALAVSAAAGLVVGIVAAARTATRDVATVVKDGGRTGQARTDRRLLDGLVVLQLGLSLVLLVGAGVLVDHFRRLTTADPGYRVEGVTTMRINLEQARYAQGEARLHLVRAVESAVRALPGIDAAGTTTVNPLCCGDWGAPIEIEGKPAAPGAAPTLVAHSYVTPGWFDALRIPLRRGQPFEESAVPSDHLTVLVDEELARMAWPGEDPIGKRLRIARPGTPWRTVVGIVPVITKQSEMGAAWYLPYFEDPTGPSTPYLHLMVRSAAPVDGEAVRRTVAAIDPSLAVYGVATMRSLESDVMAQDRLGAVVSALFASFGLILAGFSLYGLLSYSVELRRAELGTRMALGASRGRILALILGQAALRVALGIGAGLALAIGLNQLLRGMVAGVAWIPWIGLIGLTALLAVIGLAASAVPAFRATRIDPIRCLRP